MPRLVHARTTLETAIVGACLSLVALGLALLTACLAPARTAPTAQPQDEASRISVFFAGAAQDRDSPDRIDRQFIRFVDAASRTLDVAIYVFDHKDVVESLLRAADRGVAVRLVTDSDTLDRPRTERTRQAVERLREGNLVMVGDGRSGLMHHKFAVRDGAAVWTGSWNMTEGDTFQMDNNAVLIRSTEIAANFSAEFEQMFVERRFGPSKKRTPPHPRVEIDGAALETHFSPGAAAMDRLIRRVTEAHQAVHFLAFSFTHDGLGRAVRDQAARGLEVSGVIERSGSETVYSELNPMRAAGVNVLADANPSLMHHKVFIMDRQIVATGSMNQTLSVTRSNDENMVLIDDARLAERFEREFERVRALAQTARAAD